MGRGLSTVTTRGGRGCGAWRCVWGNRGAAAAAACAAACVSAARTCARTVRAQFEPRQSFHPHASPLLLPPYRYTPTYASQLPAPTVSQHSTDSNILAAAANSQGVEHSDAFGRHILQGTEALDPPLRATRTAGPNTVSQEHGPQAAALPPAWEVGPAARAPAQPTCSRISHASCSPPCRLPHARSPARRTSWQSAHPQLDLGQYSTHRHQRRDARCQRYRYGTPKRE
jgi:hypothetical protein